MAIFPKAENFVSFLATHSCARPWWVYAETFIPAFLELFLTLTILDMDDLIREFAKGKVAKDLAKSGRAKAHLRKPAYQGSQIQTDRWVQQGLKTLLVVTEPLEKIGFAWLLYSASEEFFYNWQTLLQTSPYCTASIDTGPFGRRRAGGLTVPILPGGGATPLPILLQDRAGWGSGAFSVDLPPGLFRGIFAISIQAPTGGLSGVKARLRLGGAVPPFLIDSNPIDLGPSESGDLIVSGTFFIPIIIGGGSMGWELVGPAVPTGVLCHSATALCTLTQ